MLPFTWRFCWPSFPCSDGHWLIADLLADPFVPFQPCLPHVSRPGTFLSLVGSFLSNLGLCPYVILMVYWQPRASYDAQNINFSDFPLHWSPPLIFLVSRWSLVLCSCRARIVFAIHQTYMICPLTCFSSPGYLSLGVRSPSLFYTLCCIKCTKASCTMSFHISSTMY